MDGSEKKDTESRVRCLKVVVLVGNPRYYRRRGKRSQIPTHVMVAKDEGKDFPVFAGNEFVILRYEEARAVTFV